MESAIGVGRRLLFSGVERVPLLDLVLQSLTGHAPLLDRVLAQYSLERDSCQAGSLWLWTDQDRNLDGEKTWYFLDRKPRAMSDWLMRTIRAEARRLLELAVDDGELRADLRALAEEILAAIEDTSPGVSPSRVEPDLGF